MPNLEGLTDEASWEPSEIPPGISNSFTSRLSELMMAGDKSQLILFLAARNIAEMTVRGPDFPDGLPVWSASIPPDLKNQIIIYELCVTSI